MELVPAPLDIRELIALVETLVHVTMVERKIALQDIAIVLLDSPVIFVTV